LIKILFFITFIYSIVLASDIKLASSIFNAIAIDLTKKDKPKVYLHENIKSIQQYPKNLDIVKNCKIADIVILSTIKDIPSLCKDKILFGTRYTHLKDKRVIGAFFWQKGRPNILFYRDRLEKRYIKLDASFDKYIEK